VETVTTPRADAGQAVVVASWAKAVREEWEERAAIMEVDGGLHRPQAERQAFEMMVVELEARKPREDPWAGGTWRARDGWWIWTAHGFENVDFGDPPAHGGRSDG
jgi:hypothetical protein